MILFSGEADATLGGAAELRLRLERALADVALANAPVDDLALAVAELASNAVRHGAPRPTRLGLALSVDGRGATLDFTDDGGPFEGVEARFAALPAERPSPLDSGGRGLWLIRRAIDRIDWRREGGLNHWRLFRAHQREKPAVLVVEDDAGARAIHRAVLGDDCRLTMAASLAEAREAMATERFDLILADFHVEDGTAGDLLAEADRRGDGLQTPVVIVTADVSGTAREAAEALGVHSVLYKPLRAAALKERAAAAIGGHRIQEARLARRLFGAFTAHAVKTEAVEANGLRLAARGGTASLGGGDLFLDLGGVQRRRFLLADCAGHGVRARLSALTLSGLAAGLRDSVAMASPSVFVDALSRAMRGSAVAEDLIATVLVIDLVGDGRIELATGGHPGPSLVSRAGVAPIALLGGLPGVMSVTGSRTRAVELNPGERLLAATDGLAPDSAETLDGLPETIPAAVLDGPLVQAADAAAAAAAAALGHQPADDWTFALIERIGDPAARA